MTDYYPLISRAIAGLEHNSAEERRGLYERARTALVAQLRAMEPPLTESEITRHRLALEEAIRRIEADQARLLRGDAPRSPVSAPSDMPPPAYSGTGLRDIVADVEDLGTATSQATRSLRDAYASVAGADDPQTRREPPIASPLEDARAQLRAHAEETALPHVNPPRSVPPHTDEVDPSHAERLSGFAVDQPVDLDFPDGDEAYPAPIPVSPPRPVVGREGGVPRRIAVDSPARLSPPHDDSDEDVRLRSRWRPSGWMIGLLVALLSLVALGWAGFHYRSALDGLVARLSVSDDDKLPVRPQPDPAAAKIPDRLGADTRSTPTPSGPVAQVAQRVVLYEEDPTQPQQGKRLVGSVIWRNETISPGPGQAPDSSIRADIEIPERKMGLTLTLRRNGDPSLPASHTLELLFNIPPDFAFGGIADVPGVLMKPNEQARGAPLAGLRVKVTDGFFIIGLTAVDADRVRNIQLLKERSWFDIPMIYKNGRRAIIAIEKGTPGERAFDEGFRGWGQ